MTRTEYRDYIASARWQQIRREFLKEHNICRRCDLPRWLAQVIYDQDLHVHHVSYERVGREQWGDLEPLCRRCHEVETFGRSELRILPAHGCIVCHATIFDPYADICDHCLSGASDEELEMAKAAVQ